MTIFAIIAAAIIGAGLALYFNWLLTMYILPNLRFYALSETYYRYDESNEQFQLDKTNLKNIKLAVLFPAQFFSGQNIVDYQIGGAGPKVLNYDNVQEAFKCIKSDDEIFLYTSWYLLSIAYLTISVVVAPIFFLVLKAMNGIGLVSTSISKSSVKQIVESKKKLLEEKNSSQASSELPIIPLSDEGLYDETYKKRV